MSTIYLPTRGVVAALMGLLLALAPWPLLAQDKEKDNAAPEEEKQAFEIPIPVGQTSTGVVVQNIDRDGEDQGTMEARIATRVSEADVELGDLKLTLKGTKEQPQDMLISMEKAVFNTETAVLRSRSRVHIQRADFDLYGDAMEFDTKTRVGNLFGDVVMTIHDADKLVPLDDAAGAKPVRKAKDNTAQAAP